MKFIIKRKNTCCEFTPYYSINENSFYTMPFSPCDYSVMIGNSAISLDVSSINNTICSINGYCNMNLWIPNELNVPKHFTGTLFYCKDNLQISNGIGINYDFDFEIYYDKNSGIICIGDLSSIESVDSVTIEFNINTFATICNGQLIALWIKPIFC